jgi:PAS domain S-box-containing protein
VSSTGRLEEPGTARAQLRAVADQLLAPIAVLAPDSTLLYANPAAAHSLGQEPKRLVGRKMLEFVHTDDRSRVRNQLARVASRRSTGGYTRYRLRADPADGWRVIESTADNLLDDPTVRGIVVMARDVTALSADGAAAALDSPAARVAQLEQHLGRIAAEVEASGALRGGNPATDMGRFLPVEGLTYRQRDVLGRLMRGDRVPTIAAAMFLSQSTVRNHLTALFARFGVHSQAELLTVLRADWTDDPAR